jgi:hypothetical protein
MFADVEHATQRTIFFFILLTANTISGVVGGIGITFAGAIDTTDKQILGLIFCFLSVIILLVSTFMVFLQRERERNLESQMGTI